MSNYESGQLEKTRFLEVIGVIDKNDYYAEPPLELSFMQRQAIRKLLTSWFKLDHDYPSALNEKQALEVALRLDEIAAVLSNVPKFHDFFGREHWAYLPAQ